eukprot:jgi/Chlat1/4947/Chrsp32S04941
MSGGGGPDPLFLARNSFYLGAHQAAINEAAALPANLSDQDATERDSLVYRSYIALGSYQIVIDEIASNAPTSLQAVKLLAQYFASEQNKDMVLSTLQQWLSDPSYSLSGPLLLVAGVIYSNEQDYVNALKCLFTGAGVSSGNLKLELMATSIQAYLRMDRVDIAEKELRNMQSVDDDHTLTQLSTAWVNLAVGGPKTQEAFYIFQELGDKYTWTVRLKNGSALASMQMGHYEEAERDLLEALNKDSNNLDTLANLVVADLHVGKPVTRYLNQIRTSGPNHAFAKRINAMEAAFDRAAQQFS